jgi:hypothetical protein
MGRLLLRYHATAQGTLVADGVTGPDGLGELRDCLQKEFGRVHLPAGYPDTLPIVYTVRFEGDGGEWARSDATRLIEARAYDWRYTYWVGFGRDPKAPPVPPEADEAEWFFAVHHDLGSAAPNLRSCVLAEMVRRADVDVLLVAGAEGVHAVATHARLGSPEVAACVAAVVADVAVAPAASRFVGAARVEIFSADELAIHAPEPARAGGVWSDAVLAAASAGDDAALAAALAPAPVLTGDGSSGPLPPAVPPAGTWSWSLGVPGLSWSQLVITAGDPAAA